MLNESSKNLVLATNSIQCHGWNFRRSGGQKVERWNKIMKVVHCIMLRGGPTGT